MKYAVAKIAGQQYKIGEGNEIEVLGNLGDKGKEISFADILLVSLDGKTKIGTPIVKGCLVKAEVIDHKLGSKVIISKFKAKTGYRRKRGFRPQNTSLLIKSITA